MEILLFSALLHYWAIFFRIGQLLEQYGESTLSILISQEGAEVEIENVCIVTQVRIYNKIYPEPLGYPLGFALGFPSGSGYLSPYIPPLVTIQIQ